MIKHETVISVLKYLQENLKNFKSRKPNVDIDIVADLIASTLEIFKDNIDENYNQSVISIILECFKFCLTEIVSSSLDKTWQISVTNLALLKSSNTNLIASLTLECADVMKNLINDRYGVHFIYNFLF